MSGTVRYIVDRRAEMERLKRLRSNKKRSLRFGVMLFAISLPVAFVAILLMALGYWEFVIFSLLPFVVFGLYLYFFILDEKNKHKFYQLRDEVNTETVVDKFIQTMPDDFSYVKDFSVVNNKGEYHIDLAIFSRNGAFAVTVVNAHGELKSSINSPEWGISLNTAKGKNEIFTMENPCPYVADTAFALEDLYKENQLDIPVYPILYLSGCRLRNSSDTICDGVRIIQNTSTAMGDIVRYIDSFMGGVYIRPERAAEFIYPKEVRLNSKVKNNPRKR